MKNSVYLMVCAGFLMGACSDPRVDSVADSNGDERSPRVALKADDGSEKGHDVCTYYGLYNDGWCDLECESRDEDCDTGAPNGDGFAFLCESESTEANGMCVPVCGTQDPDCDQVEPPRCEGDYDDRDGYCDAHCFPDDEDCIAQSDSCFFEYRYGDGSCDTDCGFDDPDCATTPLDESELSDWERRVCQRFPRSSSGSRVILLELATSVCIGRAPSELPVCVALCARAAR